MKKTRPIKVLDKTYRWKVGKKNLCIWNEKDKKLVVSIEDILKEWPLESHKELYEYVKYCSDCCDECDEQFIDEQHIIFTNRIVRRVICWKNF